MFVFYITDGTNFGILIENTIAKHLPIRVSRLKSQLKLLKLVVV